MAIERLMKAAGVDWEELVAEGIQRLGDELNSEKILFEVLEDGIRISIVTDDENKEKAAKLWKNHVEEKLDDGGEQ